MTDERLKKPAGKERDNRGAEDRPATEDRVLSDDERIAMFQQQFFQSALPDLPKIEGYHTCWLTTTNPRDPIQGRLRLGYEPIKPEDIPGWEYATIKSGDYVGLVGVNEMLAFKLPIDLYELYMREAHHNAPLREEQKLAETAELMVANAKGSKSRVVEIGDGTADLVDERMAHFES